MSNSTAVGVVLLIASWFSLASHSRAFPEDRFLCCGLVFATAGLAMLLTDERLER